MKNIKILAILIAVLLALSFVFVSCDKSGDETTANETTSAPATDAPATDAEVTTEAPADTTVAPEVTTEAPHTHSFGAWNTVKAATCSEEGSNERSCSCGEKETEAVAKLAHTEGEWITDKVADCTNAGSKHTECSVCKATVKTESIPALGHKDSGWITEQPATCTEAGSKHLECSVCKVTVSTEAIPALGHKEGAWIIDKDATCTEAGSQHTECSVCKATVSTEAIPALGHKDGAWIIDKEATAKADGSKHLECSVCHATIKTEVIPATPHTPGEWIVDKAATCTSTGLRHRECTKCGETVDTETISLKPHTEVVDKAKAATCTETGLTDGSHCSVCNTVIKAQQKVSALGHTEAVDKAKAATCTETGLTEGSHCSVCNAVTKTQEKIPALGHTEKATAAKAATCTETGLTAGSVCSVCNAVIKAQEKIPANGHTEVKDAAKESTCTAEGLTEGAHCSVCNAVIKAQEKVELKPHTASDWIVDKAATTAAEGSKHTECTVCKATLETAVIPKVEIPKIDYTVTVKTGNGTAVSGAEVVFTKGSAEVAKVVTDASGKAVAKLEEGEYGIELIGNENYFVSCDRDTLTVSAPTAEITLIPYAQNPQLIYPAAEEVEPNGDTYGILAGVYELEIGTYRISVEKDKMRYIFFRPTEGAIYHIYTDSDKVEVGYYGGSFFVTPNNTGKILADGTLEIEFLRTAVGNTLVIGLESTSASVTECNVTIVKHQDIGLSLEELEWTPYKPDAVFEKIETPEGYIVGMDLAVWTPLDPAATEIPVFFNEKDGYYHLNSVDGPVLYVRLGSKSSYQEALTTIVGTSNLGRYIYDENGNFVTKERYNEIITAYANAADAKYNVYPLTEDLYYILKGLADIGWYDKTSPNYIFKEEEIIVMPFNGWLFACVYFK